MFSESIQTKSSKIVRDIESKLYKDIYICMYAINLMLDAGTILNLTRVDKPEPRNELLRYMAMANSLLEAARIVLNHKSDIFVDNQESMSMFSTLIQSNVVAASQPLAALNFFDTHWFEKLTTDCQSKTLNGPIGINTTKSPIFHRDLDILSQIKRAISLDKSEQVTALLIQSKIAKSFALRGASLLLDRAAELNHIPDSENIDFFKSIFPYTSVIWIAKGILSLNPKIAFRSFNEIDSYMSQIRSLFSTAQELGETNEDKKLINKLLEDCLQFARLYEATTFFECLVAYNRIRLSSIIE